MMAEALTLARSGVRGALDWWLGELRDMVPDRLRRVGERARPREVLAYRDGELRRQGGAADGVPPRSTFAGRRRRPQATLQLGPDQGLRTALELPLAARDDLEQLLRFEMDRLTPFRADEVYFAHRITGTDHERRRLAVSLYLAPSRLVVDACEAARRLGIEVTRVELADGDDASPNLLPADPAGRRPASRLNRALALLAVVLAAAAVIIPLERQRSTAAALEREVRAAKVEAEESLALRERLDAITAGVNFVVERKIEAPMVTRLIAELTRLIPDQAHVAQLHLQDDTVQVQGYAEAASELIGALARSELLHEPQFRSPVTRDPRNELERFHISMRLGRKGG